MDTLINIETMKQEMEYDKMTRSRLNEEDKTEIKYLKMTLR